MSTTVRSTPARVRRVVAVVLAVGILLGLCGSAVADDPGDRKKKVDSQISSSQRDLDAVSADLTTALATLNSTNRKVGVARTALTTAESDLRAANRYNVAIGGKLRVAQADEAKNTRALGANTRAQGRTKALVGGLARQTYMQGGMGGLELTLQVLSSDQGDVTDDLSLADIVLRRQSGVLHRLSGEQAVGRATGNRLAAVRRSIITLKGQAAAGVTRATTARNKAANAKRALEGLQRAQTAAAGNLKKKKDKELADLRWLKGESSRLQKLLDARAAARAKSSRAAAPARPGSDGHFLQGPRPRSQILSPFGYRLHPILRVWMLHAGVDFGFGCGAPVYAAAAGDVVEAGYNGVAGNNIVIDHGRVGSVNVASQYEHLSAFAVRGGHVAKGQLIGRVGATGRATGCHLHFAVLSNGRYVDPARWIG
ncbi:M23 family metallopeptidase [Luteipulveratus flavus]|uniref:M23 family metallopeptidase n=1 Tax=Luteipulveratus flavus TaxID=3031728 RepID=A0ABT6C403_9MICO|nr:M23 family metallopeptidase [Luteipulveratus sp. YIM 133296]MDF8263689.1 M23 family metallopeptidase [Luteipulveratus sp. YIM 133296]